jgi:uncharacterized OB-fold protein
MASNPPRRKSPLNAFADNLVKKCESLYKSPESKAEFTVICKFCGTIFKPTRPWQVFCNSKHRMAYWNIERILNPKGNPDDEHN